LRQRPPWSTPAVAHEGVVVRRSPSLVPRSRLTAGVVVGLASLANGAALVFHIVGGLPLPGLLAVTWTVAVVSVIAMAALSGPAARSAMTRFVLVGLVVGLASTVAYDVTKAVLSQLDPSHYDPFEATRRFGRVLVGETAAPGLITAAGWAFHIGNGCTFAIAYAALFAKDGRVSRRRGVIAGIGWALLLETFQLVLYPGWMNIGFLDEFRQISFLSHLVFGLGLVSSSPQAYAGRNVAPNRIEAERSMANQTIPPWPWWMAPARFVGRVRPALLAASQADAIVFSELPRMRRALIPVAVLGLAAAFAALHAVTSGSEPALPLNWLRLHMDNIFTEIPLFLLAAAVIGGLSPAAGALFVISFGAFDLIAAAMHPEELHISAIHPVPFVGRFVAYWLLWLLAVEVPVVGRILGFSIRSLAGRPAAIAAVVGIATGAFTFIWTQAAPVLLRPVYLWSDIGGPYAEGFVPLQNGGHIIAVVAGVAAFAFATLRGPGRLLYPTATRPPKMARSRGIVSLAVGVARRLIVAGLLTIGLGGLITKPIDAALLFVAIAGAGPLAGWVAQRSTVGLIAARVPPVARLAAAMASSLSSAWFLLASQP
jgi:hypothetical protein